MPEFIDQLNRLVVLDQHPPQRIVSLVPSVSELLFDLGLDNEIVGITRFCMHPTNQITNKPRVGGTKKIDIELILRLKPDLVIGNKEENTQEDIEALSPFCPVWMSDVNDFESAIEMINHVGTITGRTREASYLTENIVHEFNDLDRGISQTAAYLIWNNPMMVAAGDTYINDMLRLAGYENVFQKKKRYPVTDIAEISKLHPDVIMLSSEPYPFNQKHVEDLSQSLGATHLTLVDGTYFSWYGSRMQKAPSYFRTLIKKSADHSMA